MCGIAGIFDRRGDAPVDEAVLTRMRDAQTHRGPDEEGNHCQPGVGLAHRRLSIINLSAGQQPMPNDDGSCVLTYNGEIYNYRALRSELEGAGWRFDSHSDTEVLLRAWEHWGEDCVNHLRGMFAFALWDRNRGCLFLARDRLGIKPLYFAELGNGQFIFASELKGLTAHPTFDRTLDPRAVEDYFGYGYVPDPLTIYRCASKLEPGCTLTVRRDGRALAPRRYWDIPFATGPAMTEAAAADELVARLREAVEVRLVADVPLGAFLSGGVDSSAIVALMSELGANPVNTCAIGFDVGAFDESEYAARVAAHLGADHHARRVSPDDFSLAEHLPALYDEPFADSSALPTYRVCELARERVTVALSGDGGDENLAGYRRYRLHMAEERIRGSIPAGLRRALFGPLGAWYPKADWAPRWMRGKTTFQSLARNSAAAYFHTVSIFSDDDRARLFTPALRRELQGYAAGERLQALARNAPSDHPLSLVQYLDFKTYLPGDILTKVDRASMAHALEVRVPLLDHQLVEWVSGLAPAWKLRGGEGKYLFKKALEPRLPHDILYRQKMGFAVPLAKWFRGPLRQTIHDIVTGPRLASTGFFEQAYLQHLAEAHASGRRDYSALLWTTMMFDGFLARQQS